MQMHIIKEGEINMLDTDLGLQVTAESFGHLPGNPILAKGSLDKNI